MKTATVKAFTKRVREIKPTVPTSRAAACLLLAWAPLLCSSVCRAQNAPAPTVPDVSAKLRVTVKLDLGMTKLPAILRVLSDKSGVPIECEPYLADRDILAQMRDISARDTLESLAELHDWTWRTTENGHIVIARRTLRIRQTASAIPAMMQAAIPADLRRFTGAGTTLDMLDKPPVYQDESAARIQRSISVMPKTQQTIAGLLASLNAPALSHTPLKWEQMTSAQQQALVSIGVLTALNRTDYYLLHGDRYRYMFNLDNITMLLRDNNTHLVTGVYMVRPDGGQNLDGIFVAVTPDLNVNYDVK